MEFLPGDLLLIKRKNHVHKDGRYSQGIVLGEDPDRSVELKRTVRIMWFDGKISDEYVSHTDILSHYTVIRNEVPPR